MNRNVPFEALAQSAKAMEKTRDEQERYVFEHFPEDLDESKVNTLAMEE